MGRYRKRKLGNWRPLPVCETKPEPPEIRGVPCERCEELTEEISCVYGEYWLCPKCAKAHKIAAEIVRVTTRKVE